MTDVVITAVVNTPSDQIANKTLANTFTATQTFNGGIVEKVTAVTDTYTILTSDTTIYCSKASAFTVTLPTAVVGQRFNILNVGAGAVTLEGNGSDTISDEINQTINQWENITVQCYAAGKWFII
jgi:hypothetical protein